MSRQQAVETDEVLTLTESSGNVFADMGMSNPEERLLKVHLSIGLEHTIKVNGLTQREAAERIGCKQPKLSRILRGNLEGVSRDWLLHAIVAMGRDVTIAIGPQHEGRGVLQVIETEELPRGRKAEVREREFA